MTTPTNVNTESVNAAIQGNSVGNEYLIDPDTGQPYDSNHPLPESLAVNSALAPWSSQPTATAAAAADTILKFGSGGTTSFTHFSIQNNGTINVVYRVDADSTVAGATVYVLAPGQRTVEDRTGSALHFHTASAVNFGGDTGITVEAFA